MVDGFTQGHRTEDEDADVAGGHASSSVDDTTAPQPTASLSGSKEDFSERLYCKMDRQLADVPNSSTTNANTNNSLGGCAPITHAASRATDDYQTETKQQVEGKSSDS